MVPNNAKASRGDLADPSSKQEDLLSLLSVRVSLNFCWNPGDNWQNVGFLPGHFDRRLPGLLRIRKLPESPVVAEIQADYEEELDVLKATGHTRDAWCYIIVYTAAGKFMVDIVVVIISRFLVGAGYLESVHQTLFERPWDGWIRQYAELETVQRAIYFIFGEM